MHKQKLANSHVFSKFARIRVAKNYTWPLPFFRSIRKSNSRFDGKKKIRIRFKFRRMWRGSWFIKRKKNRIVQEDDSDTDSLTS